MPSPTYGDKSRDDPALTDQDEPARRSKNRTTPNDPPSDGKVIKPPSLKPDGRGVS